MGGLAILTSLTNSANSGWRESVALKLLEFSIAMSKERVSLIAGEGFRLVLYSWAG
jgi:hypothetical protein